MPASIDGDNQSQVDAIESCVAEKVNGILITASDTKAIVPTVQKARKAGVLVIALDTTLEPVDAADATFATDNFQAGELIGKWAKATMGDKAKDAHIAFLDLATSQPSVGVQRDQGFMVGFGIDPKDKNKWGDETDPRIVGHDVTGGAEDGGRTAMENLLQKDPSIEPRLHHQRARPPPAPTRRSRRSASRSRRRSSRSTAAARASRTSRTASSAPPRSSIRC